MVRAPIVTVLHDGELNLARLIGLADRPTTAMRFILQVSRAILHDQQHYARGKDQVSESTTHSHKFSSSTDHEGQPAWAVQRGQAEQAARIYTAPRDHLSNRESPDFSVE